MLDDVGGLPFPDGDRPDNQERGAADEVFTSVVLDDAFVQAAEIHEPTAAERILYAALERAESEAAEAQGLYGEHDDEGRFDRSDYLRYLPLDEEDEEPARTSEVVVPPPAPGPAIAGPAQSGPPPAWRPVRWQRPVACVLAVVMGISVIAFALIAVQRSGDQDRLPPASEQDEPEEGL
ncbi:SCO2584 family spore wall biosynthesis protein [Streptomyces harbinensis]|uniref:SCO2584 family spore wall biosynthesis protein n=1 Tax=Streptomyces harbinensis TaxID=1176198 RepID=UPI000B80E095|nr:hypothetical protein [Streptomyces harbinensis]